MKTATAKLRLAAIALTLGFVLPHSLPAQAEPSGFREQGGGEGFQRERRPHPVSRPEGTEARRSWRDQRFDDASQERPGHLSADERRQLRRDIRDAGQDVYRPGRFHRHPPQ